MVLLGITFLTFSFSFISAIFIIVIIFSYSKSHPPTKTSCPESYPIIRNLIGFLPNRQRLHDWIADMLASTPSSTLKVNTFLNVAHGICTANPTNIQHILSSNFSNYVKGTRYLDNLYELLGHGIFNIDGHLWNIQRKIASHEFNTNSLKNFISDVVMSKLSETLIPNLSKVCDDNSVFDLQELLQNFTFGNICKVVFGVDPCSSSCSNSLSFVQAFDDAETLGVERFISPFPAIWKLKRFLNVGSERRLREVVSTINEFALGVIESREAQEKDGKNQDLLSRFILVSNDIEFEDEEQRRTCRNCMGDYFPRTNQLDNCMKLERAAEAYLMMMMP